MVRFLGLVQYLIQSSEFSTRLLFSWLLYDGYNYNSDPVDRLRNMYLGWGESFCESFGSDFSAIASSARYVGPPDGYK